MNIRLATVNDKAWIDAFISQNWGASFIISRGKRFVPSGHEALIAEEGGKAAGLLTFRAEDGEIEILTFNAIAPRQGVGSRLVERLATEARARKVKRLWLVATNDNLDALRFYQRRGFDICCLHRDAADEARKLKPLIPLVGSFGIPIRHEIELEMRLV